MKNKRDFFLAFSITIMGGLVFLILLFYSVIANFFGPSLKYDLSAQPVDTLPQIQTTALTSLPASTSQPLQTLQALQTQVPLLTQGPPLCGHTPILTILVTGIDYRGDNYLYGLADVIRIVRIDFTIPKVSIFTLDRDIWVEIPGIQDHYGITHGKLNQAYFYGVPAMGYYDGTAGGSGLLAKTLKLNFGLSVDNYLVVSMAAFSKGVDALGGIDVNVPTALDGRPGNLSSFVAGPQHLSGSRALDLARIRLGYSSLIRISDQDAIIKGISDRISSPDVILRIPALLQALNGTVLTDLGPDQINDLVCLARKVNYSNLSFAEIPDGEYHQSAIYDPNTHETVFVWKIDFNMIRQYVNGFQSGRWP